MRTGGRRRRSPASESTMKQYLDLLQDILDNGVAKGDRTGTGTLSVFGRQYRHSLADGFPLLTTKKLHLKSIINELIWFLKGDTNTAWLKDNGVSIWDEWATESGDLGPIYGAQWTAWPTRDGGAINQIDYVLDCLRHNPDSRRILFHGWNVEYLPDEKLSPQENVRRGRMALPPCHLLYQFYVAEGVLSGQLMIRSSDSFLGQPYNTASLAVLTMMLAQQADLEPGEIIICTGDSHIYLNHLEQVREQLQRAPRALPRLRIRRKPDSIYDYRFEDFELLDYDPHPHIAAPVAV
jgi:thymidylate synthase